MTLGGLQTYARARSQERRWIEQLKFLVPRAGRLTYQLIVMCDSYDGMDIVKDIEIKGMFVPNDQYHRIVRLSVAHQMESISGGSLESPWISHYLTLTLCSPNYIHIFFVVLPKNQGKREIFVHPDDEALDNQPTIFQQMLLVNDNDDDTNSTDSED